MGIQKQKWTREEEATLKAGVDKHGVGKWKTILTDPDFKDALFNKSKIDLKFYSEIRKYYPDLKDGSLEPSYAGIRPKLFDPGHGLVDFVIQDIEEWEEDPEKDEEDGDEEDEEDEVDVDDDEARDKSII